MKETASLVAVAIVFTVAAHAQSSLAGKWQGATNAGAEILLDLTAKDATLTGTLTRDGHPATLSDGKISKNTFTFTAQVNDRTEKFAGELAGDEITIWLERQGPERAIVLKREKRND